VVSDSFGDSRTRRDARREGRFLAYSSHFFFQISLGTITDIRV